ncbi:hypothetical protein GBAR_LOCUS1600 [Geodia barretti]|uniref:Uncharacterized protein n=1 Tax=Geodia barretti TaxID=519541 RepID=A0AA35QY48_GEOBA|nr:hypothetical protein GBAR_LOCUS1600 [Geodia barretti]
MKAILVLPSIPELFICLRASSKPFSIDRPYGEANRPVCATTTPMEISLSTSFISGGAATTSCPIGL